MRVSCIQCKYSLWIDSVLVQCALSGEEVFEVTRSNIPALLSPPNQFVFHLRSGHLSEGLNEPEMVVYRNVEIGPKDKESFYERAVTDYSKFF